MDTYKGIYYFDTYKQAKSFAESKGWPTSYLRCYGRGIAIQLATSSCYLGPDNEHLLPTEIPTFAELRATALPNGE